MYNEEDYEQEEDQIINEEYKIWKKNTPFLYDVLITNGLEWPSLTINWLPTKSIPEKSSTTVQKFILGTHTSEDEPNYLMIMKARLPLPDSEKNSNKENILNYSKLENKIEVETKINHQGEVNKARAMPQEDKYHIIATKTSSGEVHIFDYYKHPPRPTDNVIRPDLRLLGHSKEGYGLNWNHIREGLLLSGADDHRICVWDINSNQNNMTPVKTYEEHKSIVEDVCWSKHHENVFATVGDDRKLILWDLRQDKPTSTVEAHTQEVNSIDYNPKVETLLITASSDKTIALWDIRNLGIKLHSFDHHKNEVSAARWNPKLTTLFASYSSDRRVNVWDLNKIGKEQSAIDAEDGPVELLFTHGGHTAKISDLDWNPNEPLMCASVAEDNIVHIWEMANSIYYNDTNEDDHKMMIDS